MRTLLFIIGVPYASTEQLAFILALVIGAAFSLAFIADLLLGEDGFGVLLNSVLMLAGAAGSVWIWRMTGYLLPLDPHIASASIAAAGAIALLISFGVLRRYV